MRLLIGLGLDALALAALIWLLSLVRRIGSVNTERQGRSLLRRFVLCVLVIFVIGASGRAWHLHWSWW